MKQLAYQTTFLALIAFITPTFLQAQTKALPKESLKVTITGPKIIKNDSTNSVSYEHPAQYGVFYAKKRVGPSGFSDWVEIPCLEEMNAKPSKTKSPKIK